MNTLLAQGDILLIPIAVPAQLPLNPEARDAQGRVVLAYGDVTGHAHAIHRGAVLFRDTGTGGGLLQVHDGGAEVEHEEHAAIALDPGWWEVRRQREWGDRDEPLVVAD